MQQLEPINVGQQADDGTGDLLRNGMTKVNENFSKVKTAVDAVEIATADTAQIAIEAKAKADGDIPASQKGMAGGVAPLDAQGKVPAAHLDDFARADDKGAAGGFAPLGADKRIPKENSRYPDMLSAPSGRDLNEFIETNDYYIHAPAPNTPPGWIGKALLRVCAWELLVVQEFFDWNAKTKRWWRAKINSTLWGPWFQAADMSMGAKSVVLQASDAVDANTLTEPETIYKWINEGPNWTNFPNIQGAGYMHTYTLGTSTVVQALTIIVTGRKPYCFHRFGVPGAAWQPWRAISAFSSPNQMPNWDAGDIYVDGIGWYRWNGTAYVLSSEASSGQIAFFAGDRNPQGWLKANGAGVSRVTYAGIFSMIGTRYGAGDGVTTFNLPDLRGEFIRGWDDGRNIDSGRALGTAQAATAIRVLIDNFAGYVAGTFAIGMRNVDGSLYGAGSDSLTAGSDSTFYVASAAANAGGGDNNAYFVRPRNVALMACIKI